MKQHLDSASAYVKKVLAYAQTHKLISTVAVLVLLGGGYWIHGKLSSASTSVSYVLGKVTRETIVASVSASGQVSAVNQIDVKAKASGDLTWVGVKAGQTVYAGQALATIDATTAKQNIAEAEAALAQAQLQYQKDSAQAPIDYQSSLESLDDANKSLATTYSDTYNTLSNAYLDFPAAVTGMQNILYGYTLGGQNAGRANVSIFRDTGINSTSASSASIGMFADSAESDYATARTKYDQAVAAFKVLTRYSSTTDLETLLTSSVDTTTAVAQALQSELNLLDALVNDATLRNIPVNPAITTMRTNARGYLATVNTDLSALLNQQKSLDAVKKTISDAQHAIDIYKIANDTGNDPISLQASAQSIANQERSLNDLKTDLSYYTITAPFAGTLGSVTLKPFDSVSTGSAVATLITNQEIAQLSLNEVDVAKIKLGDKATLTFDAVDGLTLTGEVSEIDAAGTVTQGVVSYKVSITFDSQDPRIKAGMTVNASIQTDVHQDVLAVPSSAVKTRSGVSTVQVFTPPLTDTGAPSGITSDVAPDQVEVTTGISSDTDVEILDGLTEGEQIVTRTNTGAVTAAKPTTTAAPARGAGGGGFGGGAALRL